MYTITLNGNSSELSCDIFPPINVSENAKVCLLSLHTNNSIPNIEPGCNTIGFHSMFGLNEDIELPTGSYELKSLESTIQKLFPYADASFELKANNTTLKCLMRCNHDIDFKNKNSISKLLGFKNEVYKADTIHESNRIVNIMKINSIKIECNLISGSFCDGIPGQTIHEFFPTVPSGYKIIEVPRHPVFYPLNSTSISTVKIELRDQNDILINLRGEPITVRLQIIHGSQV